MVELDTCLLLEQCFVTVPRSRADDLMLAILTFNQTHSEANLWQLGPGREFQEQHSDEGKAVMSLSAETWHILLWNPSGQEGKHRAHSNGLPTCEKFAHVHAHNLCDRGVYTA